MNGAAVVDCTQGYDVFLAYQPQFEGDLARQLHEGLQCVNGRRLDCFLDQYDIDIGSRITSTSHSSHTHHTLIAHPSHTHHTLITHSSHTHHTLIAAASGSRWSDEACKAMRRAALLAVLVSERALALFGTEKAWDSLVGLLAAAAEVRSQASLIVVPVYVGQARLRIDDRWVE